MSQTGVNGPSIFPTTSVAARVRFEPSKTFYMQMGAFNAQAGDSSRPKETVVRLIPQDGLLMISEAAYLPGYDTDSKYRGKYALGAWNYTRTFDHQVLTTTGDDGNSVPVQVISRGVYFLIDQRVMDNASAFIRYGMASPESNRFGYNLSGGLVFAGLIPGRSEDRLGFGITKVANGTVYKDNNPDMADAEITYEVNYRLELFRGIVLQPDFQYVSAPNTNEDIDDARVFATRLEVSF